jgi:hypothetical protein
MPPRRRRTLDRNPINRIQMWDAKMKGDIYAIQLTATKPLALPKVASYQTTHEQLISIVKQALSNYPSEIPILQEYMWFAEKIWKLSQTYTSKALQIEADALYLWYLARGRKDLALRTVAKGLNINISSLEDIVERVLTPALISIIKKDTIIADGTEQVLLEYFGRISTVSGYVDLSNMVDEDTVVIRAYVKIKEDGEYKLYQKDTYYGTQTAPALYVMPRLSGFAFKITLQQTTGAYKNYDYLFVKGV